MVIRLAMVKSLLWFVAILLVVLSFPLQVYTNSPYPSLLPYFLIGLIILANLFSSTKSNYIRQNRNINLMVGVYLFLVLFHTSWQTIFEVIGLNEAMSVLVIYLLPTIFYWYFRDLASEQEIRWFLSAMVVGGFIVGLYFAYDSYMKFALGQVNDFARAAFQYSLDRGAGNIEYANTARINIGSRSFGLLQTHTISGAWVVLGAFAALALIPLKCRLFRRATMLGFGVMLLLGLNFSNMIAFSIIIFLFEFDGFSLLRGRISGKALRNLLSFFLVIAIIAGVGLWVAGDHMAPAIQALFSFQINMLFTTTSGNTSMFGLAIENVESYLMYILDSPLTLLFGDGFSTFGRPRGGDIGAIETLAQFGLPFYILILFGFFSLIRSGLRRINVLCDRTVKDEAGIDQLRIQFAICVTLLILILEGHYSAWGAKSILPIVFFVLALYGRYQERTNQASSACRQKNKYYE